MRLVLTGGGTGGHIYPAIEVGREAAAQGATVLYLGSHRGQEGGVCERLGIPFQGFHSEPLWSLAKPSGWRALAKMVRSSLQAKKYLDAARVEVVFSTGGYSAAPVVLAAKRARVPFVIHEANSVPGRVNRLFARDAAGLTCAFFATLDHLPKAVRTGQPIRQALRDAAHPATKGGTGHVLVTGGSQGSAFLNRMVPEAYGLLSSKPAVLHLVGRSNAGKVVAPGPGYQIEPFLETEAMTQALGGARLAVARSGGFLAELALFGLPSVLVPLPTSADDHQLHNAREFAEMGAATVVEEGSATPSVLADAIDRWLTDEAACKAAAARLREWDVPDATRRIVEILFQAVPCRGRS